MEAQMMRILLLFISDLFVLILGLHRHLQEEDCLFPEDGKDLAESTAVSPSVSRKSCRDPFEGFQSSS